VGGRLADIHADDAGVRESQLRGSGGFSPRFPNIPLRYRVDENREHLWMLSADWFARFKFAGL
jgi:hypothetical protein